MYGSNAQVNEIDPCVEQKVSSDLEYSLYYSAASNPKTSRNIVNQSHCSAPVMKTLSLMNVTGAQHTNTNESIENMV